MTGPTNVDSILREFEAMNGPMSNVTSTATSEVGDTMINEILMHNDIVSSSTGANTKKKQLVRKAVAKRGISITLP